MVGEGGGVPWPVHGITVPSESLGLGASTQPELHESDCPLSHHLSVIHLLTPSHLHTPPSPTAATPSWSFFLSLPPPSLFTTSHTHTPSSVPLIPSLPKIRCVCVCAYTRSSLLCGLCSDCREWGYSLVAMHGLLIVVASLVTDHSLYACRLQ